MGRRPSFFLGEELPSHPSFEQLGLLPSMVSPRLLSALPLLFPLPSFVFSFLLLQHSGIVGPAVIQLFEQ